MTTVLFGQLILILRAEYAAERTWEHVMFNLVKSFDVENSGLTQAAPVLSNGTEFVLVSRQKILRTACFQVASSCIFSGTANPI
jgi:hypothetical protein